MYHMKTANELFYSRLKGFFSRVLFLVLACYTESVSWVAGRTDLIAGKLFLVRLRMYQSIIMEHMFFLMA